MNHSDAYEDQPEAQTAATATCAVEKCKNPQNQVDDVSDALTPEERLWAVLYRASGRHGGAYADSVPHWAWNLIADDMPNLDCLKCAFERYMRDKSANSRTLRPAE